MAVESDPSGQQTAERPGRLRFGGFMPPYHHLDGNPTLQMRRDIELATLLDDLGYDEVWFGEHHSAGYEISASPELMIATAAPLTRRIKLGSGVNSAPFHHPLILAQRYNQLDHLTRGRAMMGLGPGQLMSDLYMMGIDPSKTRTRLEQAVDCLVPLLRGEVVTAKSDWFALNEARLHLGPFTPGGIEIGIASVTTPTGATLAGRHGLSVLSMGAGDRKVQARLLDNWKAHEAAAAAHGQRSRRDNWRLMIMMHVSHSRERARREVESGILKFQRMFTVLNGVDPGWKSASEAVDIWLSNGLGPWGIPVIGTPDDAIRQVEHLRDLTGGFGLLLVTSHNCADWPATKESWSLIAEHVIPHFNRVNDPRRASAQWVIDKNAILVPARTTAIDEANKKFDVK